MRYNPLALGVQYQLGNHQATYKPSGSPLIGAVLYSAFGALVGTIVFAFGRNNVLFLSIFLWGGFVVFLLCFFVDSYQRHALHVFVYENGLIHVGAKSLQPISWQKVQVVRHDVTYDQGVAFHSFHLTCTDGTSLRLKNTIVRCRDLGKLIEEATVPYIFPVALNTYQTSGAVAFGPITVTAQGISWRRRTLPWSGIESLKIDECTGRLVLRRKQGEWFGRTSVKVPNVEVFRMLIKHLTSAWPSPLIS